MACLLASFSTCEARSSQQQIQICGEADYGEPGAITPAHLPPAVLAAVMRSEEGMDASAQAVQEHFQLHPADILKGAPVHLADTTDRFYILIGSPPHSGADHSWFWLVRQFGTRASILIFLHANSVCASGGNPPWGTPTSTPTGQSRPNRVCRLTNSMAKVTDCGVRGHT